MLLNCPHRERAGIHNHPGVIGKPVKILHFHFWDLCSFRECPYSKFYLTTRVFLLLHGDFDLLEICIHQFGSLPKEDSLLLGWNKHIHLDENLPEIEGGSLLNPSIINGSSSLPKGVPLTKKQNHWQSHSPSSKHPHTESQNLHFLDHHWQSLV